MCQAIPSRKRFLTTSELVTHMESKGITFNIESKDSAKTFLENNNYYLKLASYRVNYQKYQSGPNKGKYIALDFAYLKELSILDMYLRYLILEMSLDIEHALKVRLLKDLENYPGEDGYYIASKFLNSNSKIRKDINRHKSSAYCKNLIQKYDPDYPIWVLVELISFGNVAYLIDLYKQEYRPEEAKKLFERVLLNSVRDIRNASAHSNCLINNLSPGTNKPHGTIVNYISEIANINKDTCKKKLSNKFVYDFVCLLCAYNIYIIPTTTRKKRFTELNKLFNDRMLRHKDWFIQNNRISSTYNFCKKILDVFAPNVVHYDHD